jgi:hypothetical protein
MPKSMSRGELLISFLRQKCALGVTSGFAHGQSQPAREISLKLLALFAGIFQSGTSAQAHLERDSSLLLNLLFLGVFGLRHAFDACA